MKYYVVGKYGGVYGMYRTYEEAAKKLEKMKNFYKNIFIVTEEEYISGRRKKRGTRDATGN